MRGWISGRPAARGAAALALWLGISGSASALDGDADGVHDADDDCVALANPDQRDTDRDGFGNACDADFDGDGTVGWSDRVAVQAAFGAAVGAGGAAPEFDLDGDGWVGIHDVLATVRAFGLPPGPSGLVCAGESECFAGHVAIQSAEEVLSGSVRLTWRAASSSLALEVERRAAGGAWEAAGIAWRFRGDFVDRGPDGMGLAPGRIEYRMRADGPWSAPLALRIEPECAGQPRTSPFLPVVEIVDHEPDGDHDGRDVEAALATCSRQRGCVLRALPVVYDDVNVELTERGGRDFSRGLVLEGYGSATVFRSRVFSSADHDPSLCPPGTPPPCYVPRPVFGLWEPAHAGVVAPRFRNFRVDGRKREQPDPNYPDNGWQHWAIYLNAQTLRSTDGGCVHRVAASELLTGGFGIYKGAGWIVEHSEIVDAGCQDDLTPCPALVRTPDPLTPGVRSSGFGVVAGQGSRGTVVRYNRAVRAAKYGIASAFEGSHDAHFHDNVVVSAGGAGIECNSCDGVRIERNLVLSTHYPTGRNPAWPEGFTGEGGQGIQCNGPGRNVVIRDNVVVGSGGTGVRVQCSGPGIVVEGNAIDGNCQRYGYGLELTDTVGAVVRGNVIRDPPAGCRYSLAVNQVQQTLIEQGRIESGPATLAAILVLATQGPTAGLVLRDLFVDARGATGIGAYFDARVSSATLYDSVCVTGFPRAVVDQTGGRLLRAQDPIGSACRP